jgi:ferredoxin-NADP reductase
VKTVGRFTAALQERRWIAPGILECKLQRPDGFDFIPGQFARFVMDGYRREYTMISRPGAESLDFCIAVEEEGRFSGEVRAADRGAVFGFDGPLGHFVFNKKGNPAVFVAAGTGVAPFVAFCRGGVRGALLLHGAAAVDRLIYRRVLQARIRSYVACISRETVGGDAKTNFFPGRVTHYLETKLAPGIYDFYLCGRRAMIRDAAGIIDRKFGGSRVFIEAYT